MGHLLVRSGAGGTLPDMGDSSGEAGEPAAVDTALARWAMGLGLFSYFLDLPGVAIGAIVCGHMHLNRTTAGPGKERGFAITGLVAGYVTLLIYLSWRL